MSVQENTMEDSAGNEMTFSDILEVVPTVLKKALIYDGVVRGLHEVAKALETTCASDSTRKVQVCFLAESCNEEGYVNLVRALCKKSGVPLVMIKDAKNLGEWVGLCKIDKDGQPRKIVGAGCVAITDYGEESTELDFLKTHISTQKVM